MRLDNESRIEVIFAVALSFILSIGIILMVLKGHNG